MEATSLTKPETNVSISPIPELLDELKKGRMIVLVDDEDRENEGDLLMAAEKVTPEAINFMAKFGRGLICLTLTEAHCQQLQLKPMVGRNGSQHGTNFTASIEAATGISTGISASDRAHTILCASSIHAKPTDIVQPGHVFPLQAQKGGVLSRAGHTEAGCDLTSLAGLAPASVICEIMNEDGTMARLPDLKTFAAKHHLKIGTIADLIAYRFATESLITPIGSPITETNFLGFRLHWFQDTCQHGIHAALVLGEINPDQETLVRVHQPTSLLDLLYKRGVHSYEVNASLDIIQQHGCGVLVLLNCEQAGDNLVEQIIGSVGKDTPPRSQAVQLRNYGIGTQILRHLSVRKIRSLSRAFNMPSITGFGIESIEYSHDIP